MDNLVDFTRYQRDRAVHIADGRTPLDSAISFVSPGAHILGTKNQLLLLFRSAFKDPKTITLYL